MKKAFLLLTFTVAHAYGLTPDQDRAMNILWTYCAACHAIEPERFVVSQSNETNWEFIHHNGPDARTWAEAIIEQIDWPSNDPSQLKDPLPPDPRWMPLGQKRIDISKEMIDHRNARQFFLDVLRAPVE